MAGATANPLSLQRHALLSLLLALAGMAWAALIWQGRDAAGMGSAARDLRVPLFLAMWVLMMVAMMLPTAAPMILAFHKVAGARRRGAALAATLAFVAAYLSVWTLAGIVACAGELAARVVAACAALPPDAAARIGGGVLVAAGFYQLTPVKERCLSQCRTPTSFIVKSWRDGAYGALLMGLRHGAYCLGCCWLLFVILFPLGIMNIAAMAAITVAVLAEKTLPWARAASSTMAAALAVYGAIVIAVPHILPTFSAGGHAVTAARVPMPGSPAARDAR